MFILLDKSIAGVEPIDPVGAVLQECILLQNHPNPFCMETSISYELPHAATVNLWIYGISGRLLGVPICGETQSPGLHTVRWAGRNALGQRIPPGTYFYRLEVGDFVRAKRMILMR